MTKTSTDAASGTQSTVRAGRDLVARQHGFDPDAELSENTLRDVPSGWLCGLCAVRPGSARDPQWARAGRTTPSSDGTARSPSSPKMMRDTPSAMISVSAGYGTDGSNTSPARAVVTHVEQAVEHRVQPHYLAVRSAADARESPSFATLHTELGLRRPAPPPSRREILHRGSLHRRREAQEDLPIVERPCLCQLQG